MLILGAMIQRSCYTFILLCIVGCSMAQQHSIDVFSPREAVLSPKQASHLPQGYFYYAQQKETLLQQGDTIGAADAIRMMAIAAFKLGNLTDSEIQSVEALQLLIKFKTQPNEVPSRLMGIYNQLGKIYEDKQLFATANQYFNDALHIAATTTDSITILNNIANINRTQEYFEVAESDYLQVISMAKNMGDTLALARSINNYGDLLTRQNRSEALPTLLEGLRLRQLKNSNEGIFGSYRHLVYYYQSQNQTEAALSYARKCLEIAKALNSTAYLKEAYNLLVELNNDDTVLAYKQLTDSINEANRQTQNLYAAMRFDVDQEKLNRQRAELLLEKERRKKRDTILIAVLIGLIFMLVILYILMRIKQIKQREVFTTESRISKKVHDEVANEVYHLMVKMQLAEVPTDVLLDDLESIYNRSRDISKEFNSLDAKLPFSEVLTDLIASYQSSNLSIINRNISKHNWDLLSQDKKNALYRVLQELMTNMKKHSQATLVAISVDQKGTKTELKYSDNGVGSLIKKQNGLQNVENRIFALKGTITFDSQPGKGFQVKIVI